MRDREEEEEEGNESQIGQNQQKVVRAAPGMKARSVGSSVLRERSCFLDGFWNDMRGGESHSYGVWFWSRSFKAPHPPLSLPLAAAGARQWKHHVCFDENVGPTSAKKHRRSDARCLDVRRVDGVWRSDSAQESRDLIFDIPECEYPGDVELKWIIFYTFKGEDKLKAAFSSSLQCDCAVITTSKLYNLVSRMRFVVSTRSPTTFPVMLLQNKKTLDH